MAGDIIPESWATSIGIRNGVDGPVFFQGKIVGYTKEYSDILLKFLLEAKRPAVYRAGNINPLDWSGGVLEVRWMEPESLQEQQLPDN